MKDLHFHNIQVPYKDFMESKNNKSFLKDKDDLKFS